MEDVVSNKIKVLAIFKFPTPYIDPLFRLWSSQPEIDLTVAYCVRTTYGETYYDAVIEKEIKWGVRLLDGYKYKFVKEEFEAAQKSDFKIISTGIRKIIHDGEYDVFLMASSYWSLTTWYAVFDAKRKHIPIVTRMTVEAERKRNGVLLAIKKLLVGNYCKNMTAGVYECRQQRDYLIHYGMKPGELFSAPCSVDNEYFIEQSKKYNTEELRDALGISKESVVFISTGMLIERKRQKDVLAALVKLKNDGYEPYYFMVGDGMLSSEIEGLIHSYDLKNVCITGQLPQNEMSKYLTISDVYILASRDDASPKALNEAMNFELPIIITTGVGTADLILKKDENGYIYTPGDVDALYGYMKRFLVMNKEERHKMGRKSREIVAECSYDAIISGWTNACKYAISKQRASEVKG